MTFTIQAQTVTTRKFQKYYLNKFLLHSDSMFALQYATNILFVSIALFKHMI